MRVPEYLKVLHETTSQDIPRYFIETTKSLNSIAALLGRSNMNERIALIGQHGCGKTMALNRIANRLKEKYVIVRCDNKHIRNLSEPLNIEIIFTIFRAIDSQILKEDSDISFSLDNEISNSTRKKIKNITAKINVLGIGIELNEGQDKILRNITEVQIKQEFDKYESELISSLNKLLRLLEKQYGKKVLIIIDDLEKMSMEFTNSLIINHSYILSIFDCAIIFTLNPEILFNSDAAIIMHDSFQVVNFPNIAIRNKEGKLIEKNLELLIELCKARSKSNDNFRVETDAYILMAASSGGNLRQLFRIFKQSYLMALENNPNSISIKIEFKEVRNAIIQIEQDFRRLLDLDQRRALQEILKTKDFHRGHPMELLRNECILEYFSEKEGSWFDVNPLAYRIAQGKSIADIRQNENLL